MFAWGQTTYISGVVRRYVNLKVLTAMLNDHDQFLILFSGRRSFLHVFLQDYLQ